MLSTIKIGFITSSRLGLPALQMSLQQGCALSVVMPEKKSEQIGELEYLLESFGKSAFRVPEVNYSEYLTRWFETEKPDLVVVFCFPYLIPASLLNGPVKWFNFHFAPLPQYRGAEPTFWQIKNRERKGGVTVHQITEKPDEGPIAFIDEVDIAQEDTHGMHLAKLANSGVPAFFKLLQLWQDRDGDIVCYHQDESVSKTYPRPGLKDVMIEWESMNAHEVIALIKAGNPWNKGAITFYRQRPFRITSARLAESGFEEKFKPGEFYLGHARDLMVNTTDGYALVLEIIAIEEGFYTGKSFAQVAGIIKQEREQSSIY